MLSFEKWVGAGNDFVFIMETELPSSVDRKKLAIEVCERNTGIGADGLVILSKKDSQHRLFAWDFYNSDGSKAEMCGNAARCTVKFIQSQFGFDECQFETQAGLVTGKVLENEVEVSWSIASNKMAEVSVDLENFKSFKGFYINTGVPHFVLLNQLNEVSRRDCAEIQAHPKFGDAQTNVTLLDTNNEGVNSTKTFERGVKDFTLACGTGVIASAFVLQNQHKLDQYELVAPGGKLKVKIDGTRVVLIGPAQLVFNGKFLVKEDANV